MSYTHPEAAPIIAEKTGIPIEVVRQWLDCEAQEFDNPTNPLNIAYLVGKKGYPQKGRVVQVGDNHGFGVYASLDDGCTDVAWLVRLGPYAGIRSALASTPNDLHAIATAIENSAWAEGHYGHSCISSHFPTSGPTPPPTPPTPPTPTSGNYIVRAGDSLSAIAKRFLGDASRWMEIYNLNRSTIGADPNLIHPGQSLVMPSGSSHPTGNPSGTKQYTVQPGDSLSSISKKFYGTEAFWSRIWATNRTVIGSNPSLIHPGQRLIIPPK